LQINVGRSANIVSRSGYFWQINLSLKPEFLRAEALAFASHYSYLSIAEVDHGIISPIFYAETNGADWNVQSGINDSKKLEVLESFVEAEAAALAEPEPETKQVQESKIPVQEEFCIT
ncbi:MAG: hypothetical protein WBM44_30310, partial [Waterburya sp.]